MCVWLTGKCAPQRTRPHPAADHAPRLGACAPGTGPAGPPLHVSATLLRRLCLVAVVLVEPSAHAALLQVLTPPLLLATMRPCIVSCATVTAQRGSFFSLGVLAFVAWDRFKSALHKDWPNWLRCAHPPARCPASAPCEKTHPAPPARSCVRVHYAPPCLCMTPSHDRTGSLCSNGPLRAACRRW